MELSQGGEELSGKRVEAQSWHRRGDPQMSVSTGGSRDALEDSCRGGGTSPPGCSGIPGGSGRAILTAGILKHDLAPDSWVSLKGTESS